jgi:hypothetical protein
MMKMVVFWDVASRSLVEIASIIWVKSKSRAEVFE